MVLYISIDNGAKLWHNIDSEASDFTKKIKTNEENKTMANMIIDFGKCKGMTIGECDEKYLKWLVSHTKVLALRNRWAARDAAFELQRRADKAEEAAAIARIEALEAEMAPVAVERKKIFDRHLCCEVWSDTGERVVPQVWEEGIGWVTPAGSEPVLDVEEGLSWSYAVRRSNSKSRMRADIRSMKTSKYFERKPFSILR
jgi:hypothetical protein